MSASAHKKPWHSAYESHVPHSIDLNEYKNIVDAFTQSFVKFADNPSFHNMGRTLTYKELDQLSKKFGDYLQNVLGLKKGDRIALMMPNILQYPIALFGAMRAGLIIVNVNPLYTARELEHQLKDSGAQAIVIFENACATLEKVLDKTSVKHVITTQIGDFLGFPKSLIVNFVINNVKKMIPTWNIPQTTKFTDAVAQGVPDRLKTPPLTHDDTAFFQYTGGTTGISKGAELSHGNIIANLLQARSWIASHLVEGKEIIITPLPLYHIFSLTANCLVYSSVGALNILITNPRDALGFIKELKKWPFTAITGLNTLFNMLNNHPGFSTVNFSSLKLTLGGGMAVQKVVADQWRKITGCMIIEAYGLTETSPAACINPFNIKDYNGFIGVPLPSTDVCIRTDENQPVPVGTPGEICIKGPQVMRGYFNRADETANVMTPDGYLKTGDIGFMTPEGFIKIVDRKKDMILVSGFNVYPNEIEEVVATNPKVLECAAVAAPDPHSGEVVKIVIVKKDQSLTEAEILDFCKKSLTGYKVPKKVEFRTELPKTPVGKVLRRELR